MRIVPALLGLSLSLIPAMAQEGGAPASRDSHATDLTLTFHQITPGENLRDANSRSGYGAMVAIEGEHGRLAVEGSFFPVQSRLIDGTPRRVDVAAWGIGFDFKQPLVRQDQARLYAIAGFRIDYWVTGYAGEDTPNRSAGNFGIRLGLGARLGPLVGEARYRFTFGDVRVNSDTHGPAFGWSAYELALGVAF
jgi:hypothetical protein